VHRIGVVDVGSNTIRLLVAAVEDGEVVPLARERIRLALGREIECSGVVSDVSIAAAEKAVRNFSAIARREGVEQLDVFLTAPGRQSGNADQLVSALTRAADHPVRVLSAREEGRLAYLGAVATAGMRLYGRVAVVDVGGASTEIAVGSPAEEPLWVRSVEIGASRLSARADELGAARAEAAEAFAAIEPPPIDHALAVGGSARAARKLVGPRLGEAELEEALRLVQESSPRALSKRFGVRKGRARILPAGIVLLSELQSRLGVPLHVCRGGIRVGAVHMSAEELAA